MPKHSQPKIARVINIFTDSDDNTRKAHISYANASQLKMDGAGQLTGRPTQTTIRRVDQPIPIDDISQLRSVQAMLEDARLRATIVGNPSSSVPSTPTPPSTMPTPAQATLQDSDSPISSPRTPATSPPPLTPTLPPSTLITPASNSPAQATLPDSDSDSHDSEPDNDYVSSDPTYVAAKTAKPGNKCKRVTRANRDPAVPHCSLLVTQNIQQ